MFSKVRKFWTVVVVSTLAFFGVVAMPSTDQSAEALNGSMFNPGLIISDSVFYDFGTMNVKEIQRFLDANVTSCTTDTTRPGCLANYRLSTPGATGSEGRCTSLPAKNDITAAELIYDVARACGINPRVILVKLQKEQGLITLGDPDPRRYEFALGMDCPDTPTGCSAASAGFFWQLYKGVGQLRYYSNPAGPFTWLKPGRTITRQYNPKASCGSQSFVLENYATAALYYYTPYVPNQSALDNLYGSGDSCGAYGNRNFWRYYSDWFGSPVGGGFLLKSSGSETYFIVDEVKYLITDAELIESLAPLGPLGTISKAYLDSFTTAGNLTPLVRNGTTDRYFFVDNGSRLRFESCEQVLAYGLSCDQAVTLTRSQIAALPITGDLTTLVAGTNGERYLIDSGTKREILDDASAVAAGLTLAGVSPVRTTSLGYLPVGKPVAANGSIFTNRETSALGIHVDETYFEIDPDTAKDINFGQWFAYSGSSLSTASITTLSKGPQVQSIVSNQSGQQYLITATGKRTIQDTENWIPNPSVLPDSLLDAIPTLTEALVAPAVVRSTEKAGLFLVTAGELRPIAKSDRATVRASLDDGTVNRIAPSALSQMTKGSLVIPPGAQVRIGTTNNYFLVDGLGKMYKVPSQTQAKALGIPSARVVKKAEMASYKRSGAIGGVRLTCEGKPYLVVAGKYYPVSTETHSHYPLASRNLDDSTCSTLNLLTTQGSRFIRDSSKNFFLVEDGKKRPLANKAQYRALRGDSPRFLVVDSYFASKIPTGKKVPLSASAIEDESATDTSSSPESTSKTYVIKSGDTLYEIAKTFGTTVEILAKLNGITNTSSIAVGKKLILP